MRLHHLYAGIDDFDWRVRDSRGLAQKHAFAGVALDQLDPRHAEDGQYQPGKPGAAAEIDQAARFVRNKRQQLRRIEEMAAPQIAERVAADQVDAPRPALP